MKNNVTFSGQLTFTIHANKSLTPSKDIDDLFDYINLEEDIIIPVIHELKKQGIQQDKWATHFWGEIKFDYFNNEYDYAVETNVRLKEVKFCDKEGKYE